MIDGPGGRGCYFLARHEVPTGLGVPPLVMHASLSSCFCCWIRLKFRALEYACKPKSAFGAASEEKSEFCIVVAVITVHLSNCFKIIVYSPLHKNRVRGIQSPTLTYGTVHPDWGTSFQGGNEGEEELLHHKPKNTTKIYTSHYSRPLRG